MDEIDRLINEFHATATPRGTEKGYTKKPNLVKALGNFAETPRVMEFLLSVITNEAEFDLARVEALKVIEIKENVDKSTSRKIAEAIRSVLASSRDNLVRNYAGMAAGAYMGHKGLFEAVSKIVHDQREDIDVRWNAFEALEQMDDKLQARPVLESLIRDPDFKESAERALARQV